MRKTIFILIILLFAVGLNTINTEQKNTLKTTPKQETQNKSVRCYNCPKNCLIKPNEKGDCGKYKNVDGELIPADKNKK